MAGGGGLGFGAGFSKGIAGALVGKRERDRQAAEKESQRRDKLFGTMLPYMIENAEDPSDIETYIRGQYPDLDGKGGKKGESRIAKIAKSLAPFLGVGKRDPRDIGPANGRVIGTGYGGGSIRMGDASSTDTVRQSPLPSQQPPGVTGGTIDDKFYRDSIPGMIGKLPGTPGTPAPVPTQPFDQPPAQTSLPRAVDMPPGSAPFGMLPGDHITEPSMKPVAQASAQAQQQQSQQSQQAAPPPTGPILPPAPQPQSSAQRASTMFGVRMLTPEQKAERAIRVQTAATEAQIGARRSIVQRIGPSLNLTPEEAREFVLTGEFTPASKRQASTPMMGVDREAQGLAMYGKRFVDLDQQQQQAVITEEQTMLRKESFARGTGTADARFNAPIDIPTSQNSGLAVGTRAADVSGQTVQPLPIAQQRRNLDTLKQDLTRVTALLSVLPSKSELAGVAPGAVLAARRRMNAYREQVAQLESVVDGMVNQLARIKAGSVGTQTEQDAERAYNAVVALKTGLTDPFGGDTQESAKARIDETIAGIERVIAGLPTQAVPGAAPAKGAATTPAKPATTPAAGVEWRGKDLYVNGVKIN